MTIDLVPVDKPADESWRLDALCAQIDPDTFFPTRGEPIQPAKRICALCDVRTACLTYALDTQQTFGIWGGLTARQRRRLDTHATPAAA